MRRVVGLVATALGSFLVVLALLLRFYVVGEVIKFPLNENTVTTLTATHASYFSPGLLQEFTGVSMIDTMTTQGDVAAGSSRVAVWNSFSYLYDSTNKQAFSYSLQRLAFDRRSAELVNCCGTNISSKKLRVSGLGYVWPFSAQKTTYELFDTTLLKPQPVSYAGTTTVDGISTYRYVENVAATRIGMQSLPGTLVGLNDQQTVQLGEYYQGTTTEWVDPVVGDPVREVWSRHLYLVDTSGKDVLNLLNATFTTTPGSVAAAASTAKSDDAKVSLLTVVLPATLGLAGLILLILGIMMARVRGEYDYEDDAAVTFVGRRGIEGLSD